MKISIIVAIGKNNEIGKGNDLLWRLPADLKRFKELTTGHAIVMGRKTFQSLPKGALPNRTNIVLSRSAAFQAEDCRMFTSLDAALVHFSSEEEVFIIGGAEIYKQAYPIADKLYLTKVHAAFPDADTFFPQINYREWRPLDMETVLADEKNAYSFTFYEYEKQN